MTRVTAVSVAATAWFVSGGVCTGQTPGNLNAYVLDANWWDVAPVHVMLVDARQQLIDSGYTVVPILQDGVPNDSQTPALNDETMKLALNDEAGIYWLHGHGGVEVDETHLDFEWYTTQDAMVSRYNSLLAKYEGENPTGEMFARTYNVSWNSLNRPGFIGESPS